MGYPPMNLTILQLPAPSSNMTKAEYKQAYGIDLDAIDIKAFRLVIFGNQKYAIDQIKEVEDGIEVYFNGRIMSISDIVQVSDAVYDVANSKPIYCHPIVAVKSTGASQYNLGLFIFDNSPTPYTKSRIQAFIDDLYTKLGNTARLIITGGYGEVKSVTGLGKSASNTYFIDGVDSDGAYKYVNFVNSFPLLDDGSVIDGVNKIN